MLKPWPNPQPRPRPNPAPQRAALDVALDAIGPPDLLIDSIAHQRAVLELIDGLVAQLEWPFCIGQPWVPSDLEEIARAAAALRETLEATRGSWDASQCGDEQP